MGCVTLYLPAAAGQQVISKDYKDAGYIVTQTKGRLQLFRLSR